MRIFSLLSLLLLSSFGYTQNSCPCKQELDFVVDYYEKNLPGYADNVYAETQDDYNTLKNNLRNEAQQAIDAVHCFKLLTYYVEFFKDNHSQIRMSSDNVDENNEAEVAAFLASEMYQNRETYQLTPQDLQEYALDDVRGTYVINGGSYTVAVVPNKGVLRDYIGVIIASESKLWKKGQVKFELKSKKDGNFEAFTYLRNHSLRYSYNYTFKDGILGDIWFKKNLENKVNYAINPDRQYEFQVVRDSVAYIRIPSFSGSRTAIIDSLYDVAKPQIGQKEYLIIDVRDNGGGSDNNAMPLLDYIYTGPIQGDKVDLYVTEDNIKMWERWHANAKKDTANYSKGMVNWFANEIAKMKKAKPGTFIPRSKGRKMRRKAKPGRVQKVAVIFNKNCASSCESLLFWAMQSDKTLLVGENSGGYVGYGEMGSVKTPCYEFTLSCTMTRYQKQRAYEADGIPPDFRLDNSTDWISQTIELLARDIDIKTLHAN